MKIVAARTALARLAGCLDHERGRIRDIVHP
jgi:hypothetical protein